MEEKIFGEKIEGIQYKERAGVYGIAFNGEWHIALVNTPRGYSLPGGGIEAGESHQECITREFIEETGYDIEARQYIGKSSNHRFFESVNGYYHLTGFFYIVDLKEMIAIPTEEDHEMVWMEVADCCNVLKMESQVWAIREAIKEIASLAFCNPLM